MRRFATGFLDALCQSVCLPQLVERRGVRLVAGGGDHRVGLCPFHVERTPSFNVWPDHFHCFGCGAHGDAIGFLMRADQLDFRRAVERLAAEAEAPAPPSSPPTIAAPAPSHREQQNRKTAQRIWDQARPATGTPVAAYLCSRGIDIDPPFALRWHPRCWHSEARAELPAMIARVEHVERGFLGISRTYLARDGAGRWRRWDRAFLGPIGGGAVRLAEPSPGEPLIVAEGIETTLAVMQGLPGRGWAALSAWGIETLALPAAAAEVVIVADHDRSGTGERAARRAADRWVAEGRSVRIALPPRLGDDACDMLNRGEDGHAKR